MKNYSNPFLCIVFVALVMFTVSCSKDTPSISFEVTENINLELVEQKEVQDGAIYTLKLINNSNQAIKQNNVFLSYPIKTSANGTKGNYFKIEAQNNKLNIQSEEELLLTVFAPKEMYESNSNLAMNEVEIEIKGYINEVTDQNQFHKGHTIKLK